MVALAVVVAVAAAALFQQREAGRWLRQVRVEFALFVLHWAQAQLEEERSKRENWERAFVVADGTK